MRNVLFTGGWAHDFAAHAPMLAAAIDIAGPDIETTSVDDLDTLADVIAAGVDLVTIYACRFRMLDERYGPEQRAEWAMEIPAATRAALTDHVAGGRPLLAVHTAAVCFDDWPEWSELLGGGWSWERSWHPAPAEMTVRLVGDHPITEGFDVGPGPASSMRIVDERYTDLVVHASTQVLAVSPDDDGVDQPVLWCHEAAGGRVVYDSLGHDVQSLTHPGHLELIARSVRWLLADA